MEQTGTTVSLGTCDWRSMNVFFQLDDDVFLPSGWERFEGKSFVGLAVRMIANLSSRRTRSLLLAQANGNSDPRTSRIDSRLAVVDFIFIVIDWYLLRNKRFAIQEWIECVHQSNGFFCRIWMASSAVICRLDKWWHNAAASFSCSFTRLDNDRRRRSDYWTK